MAVVSITGVVRFLSPLQTCLQTSHAPGLGPARDSAECLCFEISKLKSRNESLSPCLSLKAVLPCLPSLNAGLSPASHVSLLNYQSQKAIAKKVPKQMEILAKIPSRIKTQVSGGIDLFLKLASFQMRSQSAKHLWSQSKKRGPG